MAGAGAGEKVQKYNMVQLNTIMKETVDKEERTQKLYCNFSINPFKKSQLVGLCYLDYILFY